MLSVLHHEPSLQKPAGPRATGVQPVMLRFDAASLGEDMIAAAAGRIYRHRRTGASVRALAPTGVAAAALTKACDRIGLKAGGDELIIDGVGDGFHPAPAPPASRLRIAIAGFGVVGQAVAERLRSEPAFEIVSILVRDSGRHREVIAPAALTTDPEELLGSGADILVEAMSCDTAGGNLCEAALARGISVVSASKRVVSSRKQALDAAAAASGAAFVYSAAVGGGVPVLETVDRLVGETDILSVAAILNGTTNFILDRLSTGKALDEALSEAQAAGFAEANSDFDLSGADAAAKLQIIAAHAFGAAPAAIPTEWLDAGRAAEIAASGERWVQLASIVRLGGRLQASVRLVPAARVPSLPQAPEEWNAALIVLADGRAISCTGRGAGGAPTAEAIVADLHDLLAAHRSARPAIVRQVVLA